jgi:hypothetical protein
LVWFGLVWLNPTNNNLFGCRFDILEGLELHLGVGGNQNRQSTTSTPTDKHNSSSRQVLTIEIAATQAWL